MGRWQLIIALEPDDRRPLYRQISTAIADGARSGRLRPGEQLPSTRALAEQLGVHRNTVISAYQELEAQGLLTGSPARGSFLSTELPEDRLGLPTPDQVGFPMTGPALPEDPRHRRPGLLRLFGGVPEVRFLPQTDLARAFRQALRGAEGRRLADYGDPRGDRRLRVALADLLSRARGMTVAPESLLITQGAQQAIYLVARSLLAAGDRVAVEDLSYPNGCQALRLAGAELLPIPMDASGIRVDLLEAEHQRRPIRAVMLTPHHQYPTTVTLTADRREQLLRLSQIHRWMVIEDDVDHEFHYDGPPVLPLASRDQGGNVLYVGTISKVLAPGLRIGYLAGPAPALDRIERYRVYVDSEGAHLTERAVALLLEDGIVQRHVRRARRAYRLRREVLAEALSRRLPDLKWSLPAGGLALWAEVPGTDVELWLEAGLAAGVAFHTARRFAVDQQVRPFVRFGFGALTEAELKEAVARLVASRPPPRTALNRPKR